jgi:hypothetical protein
MVTKQKKKTPEEEYEEIGELTEMAYYAPGKKDKVK